MSEEPVGLPKKCKNTISRFVNASYATQGPEIKKKAIFVVRGSSLIGKCQNMEINFLGNATLKLPNLLYTPPTLGQLSKILKVQSPKMLWTSLMEANLQNCTLDKPKHTECRCRIICLTHTDEFTKCNFPH